MKKILCKLGIYVLLVLSIGFVFHSYIMYESLSVQLERFENTMDKGSLSQSKKYNNTSNEISAIKLHDEYDSKGEESFSSFRAKKDSLNKLKKLYFYLNNNDIFEYIEIGSQQLDYQGKYTNDIQFVISEDSNLVNQNIKINGENKYITPLKSLQLGKNIFLNLKLNCMEGRLLTSDDFNVENNQMTEIPVILGNLYGDRYKINDIIKGYYLRKEYSFKVIGILEKNSSFSVNSNLYNLDDRIVFPMFNFNYDPNNSEEYLFQTIIYSLKTLGYVKYNTNEHYECCINEIETFKDKFGLSYTYYPNDITYDPPDNVSIYKVRLLFSIIAIIIICIIIYIYNKKAFINANKFTDKKKLIKSKIKLFGLLNIQFISAITIWCFYFNSYYKKTVYFYDFRSTGILLVIRTVIICNLIYVLLLFSTRKKIKEGTD